MHLKGTATAAALIAAAGATAVTFDPQVNSTSGDFVFNASANYWAGNISQIVSNPQPSNTQAGVTRIAIVQSEATARPGWWFAGQDAMTFEASLFWSGSPDPNAKIRLTSHITDLDNGHTYTLVSELTPSSTQWGGNLSFNQWTKRVRWTDTVELFTGSTGTLAKWSTTNHTMRKEYNAVPEPGTLVALGIGVALLRRRRQ